jgi:hypothetical protein
MKHMTRPLRLGSSPCLHSRQTLLLCALVLLACRLPAQGQESGPYGNGTSGIHAGTVPPPGRYFRTYVSLFRTTDFRDADGDRLPLDARGRSLTAAAQFAWVPELTLAGANLAGYVTLSYRDTAVRVGAFGLEDRERALDDLYVMPLALQWHLPRLDIGFGYAAYIPLGSWEDGKLATVGKDYYTHMPGIGMTVYPDADRKWSASILAYYDIHESMRNRDITPGQAFHFEWGIARELEGIGEVGVVGYSYRQVTDDKGRDVTWDPDVHNRYSAIGLEFRRLIPRLGVLASCRHLWEYDVRDSSRGQLTVLSLLTRF